MNQAHPDKELALQLHAKFPSVYKDGNHKPEMAIALTTFEALSGFRDVADIQRNIITYPELRALLAGQGYYAYVFMLITHSLTHSFHYSPLLSSYSIIRVSKPYRGV